MLQRPWQLLFTRLQSYSVSLKKKSVFVMVKMKSHISLWEFTCADQQSLNPEKPLVVPKGKGRLLNNYQQKKNVITETMVGLFYCCWLGLTMFPGWIWTFDNPYPSHLQPSSWFYRCMMSSLVYKFFLKN